jgi:hypothetical protein
MGNIFDEIKNTAVDLAPAIGAGAGFLIGGPAGAGVGALAGSAVTGAAAARENNAANEANTEKQIQLQKDFAQHGLSWKIEDAKSSGIAPLAALGATGASYTPITTQHESPKGAAAAAGQDISRAMFQNALTNLQLQGTDLDNQLKMAQIGKLKADTLAVGQRNPPDIQPNGYSTQDPQAMITWTPQPNGAIMALPSMQVSQSLEQDLPARLGFQIRRLLGTYDPNESKQFGAKLPAGYTRWERTGPFEWKPAGFDSSLLKKSLPKSKRSLGLP